MTSKRLTGDGLYESSRMIMPEHRDRIIADQKKKEAPVRPTLDEQAIELINDKLAEMMEMRREATFILYDGRQIDGTIRRVAGDRIGVRQDEGLHWISFRDLIDVR